MFSLSFTDRKSIRNAIIKIGELLLKYIKNQNRDEQKLFRLSTNYLSSVFHHESLARLLYVYGMSSLWYKMKQKKSKKLNMKYQK
jgi:hypothetical protein